ncbi:MAG: hypothetical protein E6R02_06820 [Gammaproteobacteria bacterium]|nr:MAG: hypothetical protein E6R02_06820 [Gammaproteobacteria bacterium]
MISLYLRGEIKGSRAEFEQFLQQARLTYERPGGIRVRLQWDVRETKRFVEIIEYADRESFEADQVRVQQDPEMIELLEQWQGLLQGKVEVQSCEEVYSL